ncbi:U3 small nucleolar RNA-associated protein 12 [Nosema bombycis CQ1]|uniref:U3 small nucleolar RNA-associated protein 12 n=1 Tax=Nosema bombycis (strain CQ1 / CVCC 102059) TaxID=578461 RepID=R0MES0_NOSB1|nr:U3 small nucleolar RNA-associated protein 12 [Nosema bombycis CQ1]|eukprot:EOB12630.1 U3 small nucleolar RNA-associated protein 12 [Nosema bombycis CQ1]
MPAGIDSQILSVCADGSIILYDLVLEKIKNRYQGNTYCIDSCYSNGSLIVAGCSNNTLKIWDVDSEELKDTIVFDRRIRTIFLIDKYILIFFMDCDTLIIDYESKEKYSWVKFKKIRSVKINDNVLSVLTNKKLSRFEIDTKNKLKLVELENFKTESNIVDVDFYNETIIYITSDNSLIYKSKDNVHEICYHKQNILSVYSDANENICTFSCDKLMIWDLNENKLGLIASIKVDEGEASVFFRNYYVVGTKTSLTFYNLNTRDVVMTKEMNVTSIDAGENTLVVGSENKVIFFNEKLEVYDELESNDLVAHVKLNDEINLLLVSKLNSKVYVYELPTLDQKLILYGHSLPVKHIEISPDFKNVITTGADKVIKIWGLQFGECRKTIVNDTQNTTYINNELFMVGSDTIKYYKKFESIKEFKYHSNYVKLIGENLFSVYENSISVFKMDKYELNLDDSSEESDEEIIKTTNVVDTYNSDKFLELIEELETEKGIVTHNNTVERFYSFIDKINFNEIDSYLILLSPMNVYTILKTLPNYIDRNAIFISRILMSLVTQHKEIVTRDESFMDLVNKLTVKIAELRELIGENMVTLRMMNLETTEEYE